MFEGIEWTTVCVSLASGLAGASGPVVLWHVQARRERASVKASLLAEVSALLEMVARRHYVERLSKNVKAGSDHDFPASTR